MTLSRWPHPAVAHSVTVEYYQNVDLTWDAKAMALDIWQIAEVKDANDFYTARSIVRIILKDEIGEVRIIAEHIRYYEGI